MNADVHDALRDHGRALALRLGAARDVGTALADGLARQYDRWPRRYHDSRHLLACVRACEDVRALLPAGDAVAFALWFHDAVYIPWRSDNESRSASQAVEAARRWGLDAAFAARVRCLVEATAHLGGEPAAEATADPATPWVLDIDLGILGAPPEVYERYERDVRREYFFVGPRRWRRGRAAVVRHFLAQPRIYRTAHFREALEARARENLARALSRLEAPGGADPGRG
jgi:predicted metal-dependent HD superfamily phosphohydrolase